MKRSRRGFLAGSGILLGSVVLGSCGRRKVVAPELGEYNWSGIGFGIGMEMRMHGVTREAGEGLGAECERLIGGLERAFSLYLEDSELSVLNRERRLEKPSRVFGEVLDLAVELNRRTLGYFQPAAHGVWRHVECDPEWRERFAGCDLRWLRRDGDVRLEHALTEVSFNALVQGYFADRMAERVRAGGVKSALLHLGESVAVGRHPEGRPWRLAVAGTAADEQGEMAEVDFEDAGLAVSAHDATRVLVDPVARKLRRGGRVVAVVSGEGAAVADAFATAFAVAPLERHGELMRSLCGEGDAGVCVWHEGVPVFCEGGGFRAARA